MNRKRIDWTCIRAWAAVAFHAISIAIIVCVAMRMPNARTWIESIEDPVERGCAYVAIAIGFHAFLNYFSKGERP